jgi:hypothetical protein
MIRALQKGLEYISIECSQAATVSQAAAVKTIKRKINQLPTSQGLSVKKKKQLHQTVQSEELAQQH